MKSNLDTINCKVLYEKISYKSKIAIYGASDKGKMLSVLTNYFKVTDWVDKNFQKIEGEHVLAPENMLYLDFDYILVGVKSEETFEEIKRDIKKNGWNKGMSILGQERN